MLSKKSIGVLASAMALAVTVSGAAVAATNTQGANASVKQGRANYVQEFETKLAANLGVDQSKIIDALNATKKQMLDEAVQQGKMTQAQADKMATDQNEFFFDGFHEKGGVHNNGDVAKILGITQDQMKSELQSGKKFSDIISEHGLTADQFHQKMLDLKKQKLAQEVTDGKITQEQADQMIQGMEQHKDKSVQAPEDSEQSESN